jgi:hypothetical protein
MLRHILQTDCFAGLLPVLDQLLMLLSVEWDEMMIIYREIGKLE